MKIVIDIPEEQIKKSLEESKYIHEDEGEKGFVDIMLLYTNGKLDFVDVSRKTDFYSCKYKILPKRHGDLIDEEEILRELGSYHIGGLDAIKNYNGENTWSDGLHTAWSVIDDAETIISAENEDKHISRKE